MEVRYLHGPSFSVVQLTHWITHVLLMERSGITRWAERTAAVSPQATYTTNSVVIPNALNCWARNYMMADLLRTPLPTHTIYGHSISKGMGISGWHKTGMQRVQPLGGACLILANMSFPTWVTMSYNGISVWWCSCATKLDFLSHFFCLTSLLFWIKSLPRVRLGLTQASLRRTSSEALQVTSSSSSSSSSRAVLKYITAKN